MTVKINNCFSRTVAVESSICQGVILYPVYICIDELIDSVTHVLLINKTNQTNKTKQKLFTEIRSRLPAGKKYVGCIVYADDVLQLSVSVVQLQRMLDLCVECGD